MSLCEVLLEAKMSTGWVTAKITHPSSVSLSSAILIAFRNEEVSLRRLLLQESGLSKEETDKALKRGFVGSVSTLSAQTRRQIKGVLHRLSDIQSTAPPVSNLSTSHF